MAVGSGAAAQLPWYLRTHGARHIKSYMKMIEMKPPLFLAPNLKEVHLHKFTREHGTTEERCRSNDVMFSLVQKHLLAFRWANPNALVYLHEHRVPEAKTAYVSYELWDGRRGEFNVQRKHSPEKVLGQVMFAARDPAHDPEDYKELMRQRRIASGLAPETPEMTQAELIQRQDSEILARYEAAQAAGSADGGFGHRVVPASIVAASEPSPLSTATTPRWVQMDESIMDARNKEPEWIPAHLRHKQPAAGSAAAAKVQTNPGQDAEAR